MKCKLILLLVLLTFGAQAQKAKKATRLKSVSSKDSIASGEAIIYGNFIQRLGFSSGGFAQEIYIANVDTKDIFVFRVKPIYKSAKENTFIYHIKPGTYALIRYDYHKGTWYGARFFGEPILKDDGTRYTFTVGPNSLVNLGNWHFKNKPVSFADALPGLNDEMTAEFKNLKLQYAMSEIPK